MTSVSTDVMHEHGARKPALGLTVRFYNFEPERKSVPELPFVISRRTNDPTHVR